MAIASGEGMESVAPNIIVQQAYKEFIERKDRNQYRLSRRPFIFSCRQNDTLFGGVIQNSERIHLEDSSLSCCAQISPLAGIRDSQRGISKPICFKMAFGNSKRTVISGSTIWQNLRFQPRLINMPASFRLNPAKL